MRSPKREIHVVDVAPSVSRSAGARSRYDCSRSTNWSSPRWSSVGSPLRDHDGVAQVGDVDLRHASRQIGTRSQGRQKARGKRRPVLVDRRSGHARPAGGGQTVDDRQIEVRVLRPELVDDVADLVDQKQRVADAPMPIGWRSETTTSIAAGSTRRSAASATQGDASSFVRHSSRSASSMFCPARPSSSDSTSPSDNRALPASVIRVDGQHVGRQDQRRTRDTPA